MGWGYDGELWVDGARARKGLSTFSKGDVVRIERCLEEPSLFRWYSNGQMVLELDVGEAAQYKWAVGGWGRTVWQAGQVSE